MMAFVAQISICCDTFLTQLCFDEQLINVVKGWVMNDTELIPAEVSEPPQVELSVGRFSKPLKSAFSFPSQKECVVQMRASSLLVRLAMARQTAVRLCVIFPSLRMSEKRNLGNRL